jgi:hypothetical protein
MLNDWLSLGLFASGFVEVNDFGPVSIWKITYLKL